MDDDLMVIARLLGAEPNVAVTKLVCPVHGLADVNGAGRCLRCEDEDDG